MPYEKLDDEDIASAISMARQLNAIPPEMRGQSVSSRPTSISEDLGRMAGQTIAAAPAWLRGGSDPNKVESTVSTISGFMPPLAAEQALTDVERGEYGNAAINAAGLLPLGKLAAPLVTKAMAVMPKAAPQAVEEAVFGIRALHATPHDFKPAYRVLDKDTGKIYVQPKDDKDLIGVLQQNYPNRYEIVDESDLGFFDLSKVGTGEGAQAFGHGLYFSDDPKVSGLGGRYWNDFLGRINLGDKRDAVLTLRDFNFNKEKALEYLDERRAKEIMQANGPNEIPYGIFGADLDKSLARYDKIIKDILSEEPLPMPRVYEVNINASPDQLLDYTKPIKEQSPYVLNALNVENPKSGAMRDRVDALNAEIQRLTATKDYSTLEKMFEPDPLLDALILERDELSKGLNYALPPDHPMYEKTSKQIGDMEVHQLVRPYSRREYSVAASEALANAGIPGLQYPTGILSGGLKNPDAKNYVVFDPTKVDILNKFAQGGYIHKEGGGVAIGNDAINDAIRLARQPYVNPVASPQELAGAQAYGQAVGMQKQYDNPERLTANTDPLGYMPVNARPPEDRNVQVVVPTAKGPTYTTQEDIDRGARRGQFLYNSFVQPVVDAVTLPGDAALSKTAGMTNEDIIPRALNLAGMVTLGAGAVPVEAGSLRAGAGLYSKAERIASELPMDRMQGQQALAMLVKGGVSPEELKWTGLADRLPQQGALTKQQLVDMIRQGDVQLNETVLGALPNKPWDRDHVIPTETASAPFVDDWNKLVAEKNMLQADINQALAEHRYTDWRQDPIIVAKEKSITDRMDDLHAKMIDATIEEMGGLGASPKSVKYKSYSIPGSRKYRETLITLPIQDIYTPYIQGMRDQFRKQYIDDAVKEGVSIESARKQADKFSQNLEPMQLASLLDKMSEYNSIYQKQSELDKTQNLFSSQHWSEKNVLAHIRTNEFAAANPDGGPALKAFNLDELQSDWAQEGLKSGFKDQAAIDAWNKAYDANTTKLHNIRAELNLRGDDLGFEEPIFLSAQERLRWANSPEYQEFYTARQNALQNDEYAINLRNELDETMKRQDELIDTQIEGGNIPIAPYVQSTNQWTNLGLKKAISQALDSGADVFTWTPGNVAAERFDLSKPIDSLQYFPEWKTNRGETVRARLIAYKDGYAVFEKDLMPDDKLENFVGKELAQKISESEPKILEGNRRPSTYLENQDLQVGGEGMKDFYNNIVPKRLSEVIRKATGEKPQFQTWTIQTADGPLEVQGFRITPEMEAKLSEIKQKTGGYFPHFAYGGKVAPNVDTALRLAAEYGD